VPDVQVAFVGAGSTVFTRNLVSDILSRPELRDSTFALMDIDSERLRTSERVVRSLGARNVEATGAPLDGADYVVTSFQVGGYRPATVVDFEVPKRHGLRQTIGDALAVGGIMRGLRGAAGAVRGHGGGSARTHCCSSTSTRWRCWAGRLPSAARSAQ
jgi:alpha-galactosidase